MPGLSISAIAKGTGRDRRVVGDRINELVMEGKVIPKINPKGGTGFIYYLPEKDRPQSPQEGEEAL